MRYRRSHPWRLAALITAALFLASCAESDAPDDETNPVRSPEISRILPAEDALVGANISTLDPATMNDAEIRKVLGPSSHCVFRYTSSGKPVLALTNSAAARQATGVVKVNGGLLRLQLERGRADGSGHAIVMAAGPARAVLTPLAANELDGRVSKRREMNLVFEIDTRLNVGYRGYFECPAASAPSGVPAASKETTPERQAKMEPTAAVDDDVVKSLPNGLEVRIPRSGVEAQLLTFIENEAGPAKTASFDLDRLTFEKGKSEALPTSKEQLRSIAKILVAYPKVTAIIGGHTDDLGSADRNRRLSHARAMFILRELSQMGVDSSRLEAKGYGEDRPVASNDTEEGRAKNRRISLEVTHK